MFLLSELKRRGVFRVVLGYLAAAWLLLQIADLVLPAYGFSEQAMAILINIVVVGVFPAAILAWVFDWSPEGITLDTGKPIPASRARRTDQAIIVVLLLAVGYFITDKFFIEPGVQVEIDKSIAVLPFVNMSSDPEQSYFSDGISEEILNLLAGVDQLRVISRSSSFAYRGEDINIPEVAKDLNVAYVLEGSVRKAGDRIRITAQLIEAATDQHLWSETYDRDLVDIFAIQDEVSAHIIDQLRIELTGETPHAYRTDPETYALYLKARARVANVGLMGDSEAVRIMQEVEARDPNYVPGLMYFATLIGYESRNFGDQALYPGEEAERKIQELLDRTIELDPNNPHALMKLSRQASLESRDYPRAARLIERALEQNANDGVILRGAMAFSLFMGDFDTRLRLGKRAAETDPSCFHCISDYVAELVRAERLDEAEALARTRMEMSPLGEKVLGDVYMARGEFDRALEVYRQIDHKSTRILMEARALFAMGDLPGFERLKNEHKENEGGPYGKAILAAIEGDTSAAAGYLETAFTYDISEFGFVLRDPIFESLHEEPAWKALSERAGLSPSQIAGTKLNLPNGI